MAVRHAREQGARVLAICNTNGSTIPRESDAVLYTQAGPEIAVASTKAFLTQIVAVYLVALYLAQVRGNKFGDEIAAIVSQLATMPQKVDLVLDTVEGVRALAQQFAGSSSVLFIGRHVGYPVALEGALKLKELAYMHAEGFAAGELKHGPIALIEEGVPVIVVVPSPQGRGVLHEKIISNIQEVRARGAVTIVIAEEGDDVVTPYADHIIRIPACPRSCSRSSPRCRCRCSPASWPRPRATTSTSRATWPSPSRSSSPAARTAADGADPADAPGGRADSSASRSICGRVGGRTPGRSARRRTTLRGLRWGT